MKKEIKVSMMTRVVLIILFSFVFIYLIPYFISFKTGGLHSREASNGTFRRLLDKNLLIAQIYDEQSKQLETIDREIATLNKHLVLSDDLIDKNLHKIEKLKKLRNVVNGRIIFSPFYNNRISYIWPVAISLLLFIIYILIPKRVDIFNWKFLFIFLIVLILSSFSLLMRNFVDLGIDRKIYSVNNADINPFMFGFQLVLLALSVFLIIIIWFKCFQRIREAKENSKYADYIF